MKNLITIVFLCVITQSFAFNADSLITKETVSSITESVGNYTTDVDTSKVTHKFYNDIKSAMIGLAKGLSTTADNVWDILVKQQFVKALAYMVPLLFLIIEIFFLLANIRKAQYDSDDWNRWATFSLINLVCIIISSIVVISNVDIILTGFINPEYGAINDIFHYIQSIK